MERRNRTVIGSYANRDEALDVVRRLKDEGYQQNEITLYANRDTAQSITDSQGVDVSTESTGTTDTGDDRSLWDQIKDAFSTDTYDTTTEDQNATQSDDILYPYRDDINNGNVVVVVENYRGDDVDTVDAADTTTGGVMGTTAGFPNADPAADPTVPTGSVTGMTDGDNLPPETDEVPPSDTINTGADTTAGRDVDVDVNDRDRDEKIRLKEERLNVDKDEVTTGEVNVKKEVVHDTETVEVPVEHEEVVIERKPVAGEEATTDGTFDEGEETMNIPVKEERVDVNKRPVVKEEVDIKKETHEDVERVSEDVRREELDVDTEGNVRVEGSDEDLDRRNKR